MILVNMRTNPAGFNINKTCEELNPLRKKENQNQIIEKASH